LRVVDTEKRIRGILAGKVIFDTKKAKLVWEHKYFPQCVEQFCYIDYSFCTSREIDNLHASPTFSL
jgi:uncharacterized protein (DUF427 family)